MIGTEIFQVNDFITLILDRSIPKNLLLKPETPILKDLFTYFNPTFSNAKEIVFCSRYYFIRAKNIGYKVVKIDYLCVDHETNIYIKLECSKIYYTLFYLKFRKNNLISSFDSLERTQIKLPKKYNHFPIFGMDILINYVVNEFPNDNINYSLKNLELDELFGETFHATLFDKIDLIKQITISLNKPINKLLHNICYKVDEKIDQLEFDLNIAKQNYKETIEEIDNLHKEITLIKEFIEICKERQHDLKDKLDNQNLTDLNNINIEYNESNFVLEKLMSKKLVFENSAKVLKDDENLIIRQLFEYYNFFDRFLM